MSSTVNVRSVQALSDLNDAVVKFDVELKELLRAAEHKLQQSEQWLQDRLRHWRIQVQSRQDEVRRAEAALAACKASGYYDPDKGTYYTPPCTGEQYELHLAINRLREAQRELSNVETWVQIVNREATAYRDQVVCMTRMCERVLPGGASFLHYKVEKLQDYLVASASPAGSSAPPSSISSTGGVSSSVTSSPAMGALASTGLAAAPGSSPWVCEGIQSVSVDAISLADSPVTGLADFHKVSAQEMTEGLAKLQNVVMPAIAQGADADYFSQLDASQGLDYASGYRRIYDAFYGQGAIVLNKVGNQYQVVNGYHRLFLADQLGMKNLPALVYSQQP
ncbi:MAG: hypothetical protein M1570_11115 [Chloroflexi bacterium]|nr:hypothetical protein [Chloroflexota bacterium]